MSKIGKKPIVIPPGVEVTLDGQKVTALGPQGRLELTFNLKVSVKIEEGKVITSIDDPENRKKKALWGTTRSLINNLIKGVAEGYEKQLEIVGVGYRAQADSAKLSMQLGYSHPVVLDVPAGLSVKVEKNIITVRGSDKQQVGQFAATVRSQRPPEPYKGKGIKYASEVVRRKAGKVVKAAGTA